MKSPIPIEIFNQLEKIKNAQAILFTGSRVLGKINKNSDWDFFIILKQGEKRWRKTWKYKNTWIEIFCNDEKQIIKELKEDLDEGRGVTTHMFGHGIIIKDTKQSTLKKLTKTAQRNWKKGPNKLTSKEKNFINYNISGYIQDINDCLENNNRADLLFNQALSELIRYYYRLNNYWLPRPKDRLYDLAKRNKVIRSLTMSSIKNNNWKQKAALITKLGKLIGKENDLSLNGELYIAPEIK